jgi:hypothetical protein
VSDGSHLSARPALLESARPAIIIHAMSGDRSGSGPEERADDSWATETLPLSVRKELLERELKKLGFRRAGAMAGGSVHHGGTVQQQQQPQGGSSHPQADGNEQGTHGD